MLTFKTVMDGLILILLGLARRTSCGDEFGEAGTVGRVNSID